VKGDAGFISKGVEGFSMTILVLCWLGLHEELTETLITSMSFSKLSITISLCALLFTLLLKGCLIMIWLL